MNTSEWEQSIDLMDDESSDSQIAEVIAYETSAELNGKDRQNEAESIINRVMEIAQSSSTIERILERRHEVKDIAATDAQKQHVHSQITEFINPQRSGSDSARNNLDHSVKKDRIALKASHLIIPGSFYGYVVYYGFFSLVLALASAVIIVNLFT
jgi:hypothetical protein